MNSPLPVQLKPCPDACLGQACEEAALAILRGLQQMARFRTVGETDKWIGAPMTDAHLEMLRGEIVPNGSSSPSVHCCDSLHKLIPNSYIATPRHVHVIMQAM